MEYAEIYGALKQTEVALERMMRVVTIPQIDRILCKSCVVEIKKRIRDLTIQKQKLQKSLDKKQETLEDFVVEVSK